MTRGAGRVGIAQNGEACHARNRLLEKLDAFPVEFGGDDRQSGQIPTRMRKTRDEARRDRIPDHLPGAFPVVVDVIVWTRGEMEERLAQHDRLACTILAEGEALFERGAP